MRIAIGSDHRGHAVRAKLLDLVRRLGHEVVDMGVETSEPVDYPDIAERVARKVVDHEVDRVVGQHAKEGWAAIDERKAHKEQLAEEAGVDTGSLSKLPDGDYMVLPEFERKVLEGVNSKLAEANNEVIKTLREKRALEGPPPSDG